LSGRELATATASGRPTASASRNPYKVSFSVIQLSLSRRSLRMISERSTLSGDGRTTVGMLSNQQASTQTAMMSATPASG